MKSIAVLVTLAALAVAGTALSPPNEAPTTGMLLRPSPIVPRSSG